VTGVPAARGRAGRPLRRNLCARPVRIVYGHHAAREGRGRTQGDARRGHRGIGWRSRQCECPCVRVRLLRARRPSAGIRGDRRTEQLLGLLHLPRAGMRARGGKGSHKRAAFEGKERARKRGMRALGAAARGRRPLLRAEGERSGPRRLRKNRSAAPVRARGGVGGEEVRPGRILSLESKARRALRATTPPSTSGEMSGRDKEKVYGEIFRGACHAAEPLACCAAVARVQTWPPRRVLGGGHHCASARTPLSPAPPRLPRSRAVSGPLVVAAKM
jgi:hypothetical protein